ncbi:AlpA family transcriptional regulator [Thermosporothrix hazakensis]|jgi:excisionase family DNA binding protein|uniref:AlpA family transcriptional regulator n=1 Tax=Thermosporothrix hazakensis TaxID=644383 RepID=A0A326U1R6_THEHA|nr:helix-turn-helix domain-containing protein [Thermosporothrix hazakensis]PZW23905.1 AlpA family transcriptional regulator [Thermosporothrix hazakensis]GCE48497.1 hypothetical protein KTH_33660 [Thermosporothrix hazakensis]
MKKQEKVLAAQQRLMSIAEVANYLGVCRQTVYNYIYRAGMPSIKVRGVRRVKFEALNAWLNGHEQVLV